MKKDKKLSLDLIIATVVMTAMVIIIIIEIIWRFAGHPLSWTEEVAKWMMIWITFAGASYGFKNGGLISVDYFVKKFFKPKTQKRVNIIAMFFMIGYFCIMTISSVSYLLMTLRKSQTYPITKVPYAITITALILGSVFSIIYAVKQIIGLMGPLTMEGKKETQLD